MIILIIRMLFKIIMKGYSVQYAIAASANKGDTAHRSIRHAPFTQGKATTLC